MGQSLSAREVEILELLAAGETNGAIARKLNLSANTVKQHAQHIYQKLHVRGRVEATTAWRALRRPDGDPVDADERLARAEELRTAHQAGTLLDLCDVILADGIPLNPKLERALWRPGLPAKLAADPAKTLTRREREVLDLLGEGLKHREVARKLFVSVNTVRHHVYNIYRKGEVHNIVAALKAFPEGS